MKKIGFYSLVFGVFSPPPLAFLTGLQIFKNFPLLSFPMKNVCALGGEMKPTTERYRCSEILMLFSGVFIVPHHYQRNKLIHHVVELMFLVGCQRKKLSGLYFFVVSINNLFKNAIIWGKFLSDI